MTLSELNKRLKIILPEKYRETFEKLEPVSMGSASLKFDAEGKVAWDEIWGSFCHLAMAGGPPHKGRLLLPGSPEEIEREPRLYRDVVEEECRGIRMACDLAVDKSDFPGWIQLFCDTSAMTEWMLRAIAAENVSVRRFEKSVLLPAGPLYRLEKEIKNVITVTAKTSHYWLYHMSPQQHRAVGETFAKLNAEAPLLEPGHAPGDGWAQLAAEAVREATGVAPSPSPLPDWLGFPCTSINAAVWMMRAAIVTNILARREDETLFLPLDPLHDPDGAQLAGRLKTICRLAPC